MSMHQPLRLLLLLILNIGTMFGQASMQSIFQNVSFHNYTMEDGLSANYCYDVLQDKKGYIWVATLNGLNRFNGKQWISFQQQTEKTNHKLPYNWVVDIDSDSAGNVWANTINGLVLYNYDLDSIIQQEGTRSGWGKIACIGINEVFTSSWQGIKQYSIHDQKTMLKKTYQELKGNTFNHLLAEDHIIWACPEDHPSIIKIDSKKGSFDWVKKIRLDNTEKEIVIKSVQKYTKDTLLLNTEKNGLLKYHFASNTSTRVFKDTTQFPMNITCSVIYRYNNEEVIIMGTPGSGLFVHIPQSNKTYNYKHHFYDLNGIPSNYILSIYIDNNDGIWIATSKGLSYFHPILQQNKYYHFYEKEKQSVSILINCVSHISENEFLVGTDGDGLFLYNSLSNKSESIPLHNSNTPIISSFYKIDSNNVYVSTNSGLYVFNSINKKCTEYIVPGIKNNLNVLRIKKIDTHLLGICTSNGLIVYNIKNKNILYNELENGRPRNEKMVKDVALINNEIWILRFFRGLEVYSFNTKKLLNTTPPSLLEDPVDYHNLSFDNKKHIFISSSAGLIVQNIHKKEDIQLFNTADGLEGDIIENVLYVANKLYYTTREAIYYIEMNNLQSSKLHQYTNYPQKWHNQLEMLTDSSIIYTISDHFIIHHPALHTNDKELPKSEIEEVMINGTRYRSTNKKWILQYDQNNISIQLAGLVYPNGNSTVWKYYLDNKKDIHTTKDGKIELNYLSPGEYRLVIQSQNYEGKMHETAKIILIKIQKPYYRTWWFYSLIVLAIISLASVFVIYRRRQEKKMISIRNQISRDLHDELGANVSSINIMSNLLLKEPGEKNKPVVENISRYSVQISDTINDIIWNINPRFDNLDELIKKMVRYASETLDAAEINYIFSTPDSIPKFTIQNKYKYHLYLIFKETINNAAKYSKAKNITINIHYADKKFGFYVEDNGIGFNSDAENKGNGLRNIKNRAEEIKATITINSVAEKGTKVELNVKII